MTSIINERTAAVVDEPFVVFLIGMRINHLWKVHKWWPVARAMGRMLEELYANPELGLKSHEMAYGRTLILIQYWQSVEQLEAYAAAREQAHLPAWQAFNKAVGSNGDVGIWHETYSVEPGAFEAIYGNMPRFGLGKAFGTAPATGSLARAASRRAISAERAANSIDPLNHQPNGESQHQVEAE